MVQLDGVAETELLAKRPKMDSDATIRGVVAQLKSKGIFDQFRKECLAEADTKPSYINIHNRVSTIVDGFLRSITWTPSFPKNNVRNNLRKKIEENIHFKKGIDNIVEQALRSKINAVFYPIIEQEVFDFMGIERPRTPPKQNYPKAPTPPNVLFDPNVPPPSMLTSQVGGSGTSNPTSGPNTNGPTSGQPFPPTSSQAQQPFPHDSSASQPPFYPRPSTPPPFNPAGSSNTSRYFAPGMMPYLPPPMPMYPGPLNMLCPPPGFFSVPPPNMPPLPPDRLPPPPLPSDPVPPPLPSIPPPHEQLRPPLPFSPPPLPPNSNAAPPPLPPSRELPPLPPNSALPPLPPDPELPPLPPDSDLPPLPPEPTQPPPLPSSNESPLSAANALQRENSSEMSAAVADTAPPPLPMNPPPLPAETHSYGKGQDIACESIPLPPSPNSHALQPPSPSSFSPSHYSEEEDSEEESPMFEAIGEVSPPRPVVLEDSEKILQELKEEARRNSEVSASKAEAQKIPTEEDNSHDKTQSTDVKQVTPEDYVSKENDLSCRYLTLPPSYSYKMKYFKKISELSSKY